MIPYGHQSIDEADIDAVVAVLRGEWLTQGPHVEQLEDALCQVTEARFAIAFANGTAALHAAAAVTGLGPGDLVATSPLTFAASAAAALYVGATPCFLDIRPDTLNLDLDRLTARHDGVVAVHYAGLPVDLSALPVRPRVVIEDAAHALGGLTPDGPVGNCAHSDLCTFSFHPVKAITTGEGGAVTTNSALLADRLRRFRTHGIERRPEHGGWYYEIKDLGFNYRLSDVQAALGNSQLRKLDAFIATRNRLADRYREKLGGAPIDLPPEPPDGWRHAYHLFSVGVPDRRRTFDDLRAAGIGTQVHYVPVYRHPLYAPFAPGPDHFPETERAYARLLSLPIHPALDPSDQDLVVDRLLASL